MCIAGATDEMDGDVLRMHKYRMSAPALISAVPTVLRRYDMYWSGAGEAGKAGEAKFEAWGSPFTSKVVLP